MLDTSSYQRMVGTVLAGRWELLELIGSGGMSVVFKARNTQLDSLVCIKVLRAKIFEDTLGLRRIQTEAKALAALHHEHVLRIIAMESDGNRCFLVTEFVDGHPLDRILADGPLEPERAKQIFKQIAEALSFAHAKNIIHRDLKPGNIMLREQNGAESVKILDFGIAKLIDADTMQKLTKSGAMLGTPQYMAPEQCASGKVDQRTDIYALGCMLYECISGKPPFSGNSTVEILMQHMSEQAPPLQAPLGAVAARAMAKEPADRYQTAQEFADALFDSSSTMPPLTLPSHGRRKFPIDRRILLVIVALLLTFAATPFVLSYLPQPAGDFDLPPYNKRATDSHNRTTNVLTQKLTLMRGKRIPNDLAEFENNVDALLNRNSSSEVRSEACQLKGWIASLRNDTLQSKQWLDASLRIANESDKTNGWAAAEFAYLLLDEGASQAALGKLSKATNLEDIRRTKDAFDPITLAYAVTYESIGRLNTALGHWESLAKAEQKGNLMWLYWKTHQVENSLSNNKLGNARKYLKEMLDTSPSMQPDKNEYLLAAAIMQSHQEKSYKPLMDLLPSLFKQSHVDGPYKKFAGDQYHRCWLRIAELRLKTGDHPAQLKGLLEAARDNAYERCDKLDWLRAKKLLVHYKR